MQKTDSARFITSALPRGTLTACTTSRGFTERVDPHACPDQREQSRNHKSTFFPETIAEGLWSGARCRNRSAWEVSPRVSFHGGAEVQTRLMENDSARMNTSPSSPGTAEVETKAEDSREHQATCETFPSVRDDAGASLTAFSELSHQGDGLQSAVIKKHH